MRGIGLESFVSRRAALIGLVSIVLPSAVRAQKPPTLSHIGWLSAGAEPDPFLEAFREGLRRVGYVEGQNVSSPAVGGRSRF
jgi:hypothetical protein